MAQSLFPRCWFRKHFKRGEVSCHVGDLAPTVSVSGSALGSRYVFQSASHLNALFHTCARRSLVSSRTHRPCHCHRNLIKKLLVKDPKDRLTASQALVHPWFEKVLSDMKRYCAFTAAVPGRP